MFSIHSLVGPGVGSGVGKSVGAIVTDTCGACETCTDTVPPTAAATEAANLSRTYCAR